MIATPVTSTTVYYYGSESFEEISNRSFKTLKSLNPDFMHSYFKKGSHSASRKNDLVVYRAKTSTFGEKSLRTLGPKIWNSQPEDVRDLTSLQNLQN